MFDSPQCNRSTWSYQVLKLVLGESPIIKKSNCSFLEWEIVTSFYLPLRGTGHSFSAQYDECIK